MRDSFGFLILFISIRLNFPQHYAFRFLIELIAQRQSTFLRISTRNILIFVIQLNTNIRRSCPMTWDRDDKRKDIITPRFVGFTFFGNFACNFLFIIIEDENSQLTL
jgi:hypothetical protein